VAGWSLDADAQGEEAQIYHRLQNGMQMFSVPKRERHVSKSRLKYG